MTHSEMPTGKSLEAIDQEKTEYRKRIESQLSELDARLKKLEAEAVRANAGALIENKEQIRKLRAEWEETADQLERLRNAGEDAWVDLKLGIDTVLDELKTALDAVVPGSG